MEIVLDNAAVSGLMTAVLQVVNGHYVTRPRGRMTALETLNALGSASGILIAGVPESERDQARAFFLDALDKQVAALAPAEGAAT